MSAVARCFVPLLAIAAASALDEGAMATVGCGVWEACFQGRCCGSGSCLKANAVRGALGCGIWEACYSGRCCGSGSCRSSDADAQMAIGEEMESGTDADKGTPSEDSIEKGQRMVNRAP